jgi:hypothetical protein
MHSIPNEVCVCILNTSDTLTPQAFCQCAYTTKLHWSARSLMYVCKQVNTFHVMMYRYFQFDDDNRSDDVHTTWDIDTLTGGAAYSSLSHIRIGPSLMTLLTSMRINACRGSEAVPVTYGKQSLDASHTPVSADQIPASPVLLFKAPAGTVFLADVQISIPVDRSIMDLVKATEPRTSGEERRRKLLQTTGTSQRLMQHWFDSSTKVGNQLFVLAFLPGLVYVASTLDVCREHFGTGCNGMFACLMREPHMWEYSEWW